MRPRPDLCVCTRAGSPSPFARGCVRAVGGGAQRAVRRELETPLARALLEGRFKDGDVVRVDLINDRIALIPAASPPTPASPPGPAAAAA